MAKGATFSFGERERVRATRRHRRLLAFSFATAVAVGFAVSPVLLPLAPAALVPQAARALAGDVAVFAGVLLEQAWAWVRSAHRHTPALALGITVAILALPLVAIGALVRVLSPPAPQAARAEADGEDAPDPFGAPSSRSPGRYDRTGLARPRRVWLEREGDGGEHALTREMTRIGSAADNEVRIARRGVERYHAAIARTPEFDHYLVALTADVPTSLNGTAVSRRRLRDRDVIAVGEVRLVFRAGVE